MPTQLELPFTNDDGFDDAYLDAKVALNLLRELDFDANRQVIEIYPTVAHPRVHLVIGWSFTHELASEHDRDIFAQVVEDTGNPMARTGDSASVTVGPVRLTLNGAFEPHSEERPVTDRPTLNDLYPATGFGERGARGRLNPVIEGVLKAWTREDR